MKKRLISLVLALVLLGLTAVPSTAAGSGFKDVKPTDYFADAVQWAVDRNITTGTSATAFSPNQTCTQAQILTFLWRAKGSPKVNIPDPFYGEISSSSYYYNAALWAYQNGLIGDFGFQPSEPCTRGMAVTYLWKLAGSPTNPGSSNSYAPYTISGKTSVYDGSADYIETPITIAFSGVSAKKVKLPCFELSDELQEAVAAQLASGEKMEATPFTMLTLQPGSAIRFSVNAEEIVSAHGSIDSDHPKLAALYDGTTTSDIYWAATDVGMLLPGKAENFNDWGSLDAWISPSGFKDEDGNDYIIVYGGDQIFSDVRPNADYGQAVAWAVEKGVTTGTTATTFSPDRTCTRGQIATFLYRALA